MRQPVTLGSRVPLCPVFSILFLSVILYAGLLIHVIPEHALHPGDHFMTGRVGRFIEIDHSGTNIGI